MKTQKILSLDVDLVIALKSRKENVSQLVNNYLRQHLQMPEPKKQQYNKLKEDVAKLELELLDKKARIAKGDKILKEQAKRAYTFK